jgi:hypothetical protein
MSQVPCKYKHAPVYVQPFAHPNTHNAPFHFPSHPLMHNKVPNPHRITSPMHLGTQNPDNGFGFSRLKPPCTRP